MFEPRREIGVGGGDHAVDAEVDERIDTVPKSVADVNDVAEESGGNNRQPETGSHRVTP
jgi:hypothetical protein